jgi:hypothetical protein
MGDYNYFNNRYLRLPTLATRDVDIVQVLVRLYDRKNPPNAIAIIEAAKSSMAYCCRCPQ